MLALVKRLLEPLLIRVDFTEPVWAMSPLQARCWLASAVATDLLVQYLAGTPTLLTILASLLTMGLFWAVPARLAGAVGGLYISQALGSLALVSVVDKAGYPNVSSGVAMLWGTWGMVALAKLVLSYIRTPKSHIAG